MSEEKKKKRKGKGHKKEKINHPLSPLHPFCHPCEGRGWVKEV